MKKLRIAIDCHYLEGQRTGVGRYLENILKVWLKKGIGADFYLYFKAEIPKDDFLKASNLVCRLAPRLVGRISNFYFQHVGLTRLLLKDRPDLFWGPGYLLPLFYRGPALLTVHDIIYEARPDWYTWPSRWDKIFLRAFGRWSARHASALVVPSEFTKSEVIKFYRVKNSRITVTPLAVSDELKPARKKDSRLFNSLGITKDYILFVGALIDRRCIKELIEAFLSLRKDDLRLVLAGPDQLGLKKIPQNVIHLSYVDKPALGQLYSFAKVTVALSLYEGFGLPPLEAMACGSPAIVSAIPAHLEVCGRAALKVNDPLDKIQIAAALDEILNDNSLASRLKQAGFRRAAEFSWRKTAAQTWQVIDKLCGRS